MKSGVNAGSGVPCSYSQSWGNVPMLHYGVRRSVLVNLDLEVRDCLLAVPSSLPARTFRRLSDSVKSEYHFFPDIYIMPS